jgi:hypothetical protein
MQEDDVLRKKIAGQFIVNLIVSFLCVFTIIIFAVTLGVPVLLILAQLVLSAESLLTGMLARRASAEPTPYSTSRYARIQFVN